ncbi:hypothetical protein RvY_07380 [Ramazzottius varieornatus]|uniref:ATP synthase F(0) complex subunit e, mitochondrial n=1 Tax=Ramazzottius varieornatus TaxID=947166 RepID=A0A1D1V543_RAMVA|nr:hypothetical protein RvY_07380 [Ramazzottius varieornatus]
MDQQVSMDTKPSGATLARQTAFVTQRASPKPPPKPLLPPAPISPTIRVARWAALIAGLSYGVWHNRRLVRKEERLHEIEERKRPAREAAALREKNARTREEMLVLAREVGVPVPDDFEDQFRVTSDTKHGKH